MFRDTALDNYTINQTEVPILPSKESRDLSFCLLPNNKRCVHTYWELKLFEPPPAGYQSWSRHQESGSTFSSSALLATHSGVDSTFQVSRFFPSHWYWRTSSPSHPGHGTKKVEGTSSPSLMPPLLDALHRAWLPPFRYLSLAGTLSYWYVLEIRIV